MLKRQDSVAVPGIAGKRVAGKLCANARRLGLLRQVPIVQPIGTAAHDNPRVQQILNQLAEIAIGLPQHLQAFRKQKHLDRLKIPFCSRASYMRFATCSPALARPGLSRPDSTTTAILAIVSLTPLFAV